MLNLKRSGSQQSVQPSDALKSRRTIIEDISEFGYELPREQLRLVVGGLAPGSGSAGTSCEPGMCDDD